MCAWIRDLHALRALAASQACASRGGEPRNTALCAERKTCCAASSASKGSRNRSRQSPSTIRPCSANSLATRAPAAPGSGRPAEGDELEFLGVSAVGSLAVFRLVLFAVI